LARQDKDSFTPITDLREMGSAVAIIKRDVREMRPEVKETAKAVVKLATKQQVADAKLKTLEDTTGRLDRKTASLAQPRAHDCMNINKIGDLEEDSKKHALGVTTNKKDVVAVLNDVGELKKGQSRFIYWLLGAAFVVIGSVFGWYASYNVTRNEVRHLTNEQTKIRINLESLQKTTKNIPIEINTAVARMETAANQMDTTEESVPLDDVWCYLSARDKVRLKRRLPADKIPTKRCKR